MQYKYILASLAAAGTVLAKPIEADKRDLSAIKGFHLTTETIVVLVPDATSIAGVGGAQAGSNPSANTAASSPEGNQGSGSNNNPAPAANPGLTPASPSGGDLIVATSVTTFTSTIRPTQMTVGGGNADQPVVVTGTTVVPVYPAGVTTGTPLSSSTRVFTTTSVVPRSTASVLSIMGSTFPVTVTNVFTTITTKPSSTGVVSSPARSIGGLNSSSSVGSFSLSTSLKTTLTGSTTVTKAVVISTVITANRTASTVVFATLATSVVPAGTVIPVVTSDVITPPAPISTSTAPASSVISPAATAQVTSSAGQIVSSPSSMASTTIAPQTAGTTVQSGGSQPTAVAQASEPFDITNTDFQNGFVDRHNQHRRNHSAPNVAWDDNLASIALTIARSCSFAHQLGVDNVNYGQNIDARYGSTLPVSLGSVVSDSWYSEEVFYQDLYGQSSPQDYEAWGHFTQEVWVSTTTIGCATVNCPSLANAFGGHAANFTVCNYLPPGNVYPEFDTNVLPGGQAP